MINRGVVGCQIELEMGENEPGNLGQAKKRRKSAGRLLTAKEKKGADHVSAHALGLFLCLGPHPAVEIEPRMKWQGAG